MNTASHISNLAPTRHMNSSSESTPSVDYMNDGHLRLAAAVLQVPVEILLLRTLAREEEGRVD